MVIGDASEGDCPLFGIDDAGHLVAICECPNMGQTQSDKGTSNVIGGIASQFRGNIDEMLAQTLDLHNQKTRNEAVWPQPTVSDTFENPPNHGPSLD